MSMATDRPVFRTDLVAKPIDGGNGSDRLVEVTDPDSGKSFRFYEIEYAIACAMDGERDVSGLVEWANIELGLEPAEAELVSMIGTLGELGYLEGVAAAQPAAAQPAPAAAKAGSVTRGWDAVDVPDELVAAPIKAPAAAAPAKAGSVTRGWDAVDGDAIAASAAPAAAAKAPAVAAKAPAAPAKSGSVTRGWDAVDGDAIAAAAAPPAAAAKAPAAPAKAPTKVTPPAAGGVTRGWDAVDGDALDLGAPGKAATPAAPPAGGVTRGWDVQSDDLELGFAGRQGAGKAAPAKPVADVELGQAGNVGMSDPDAIEPGIGDVHERSTKQRPATPSSPDFNTDLSEHMGVRADDVKEAVRASKVHAAVKVPEDYDDDQAATAVGGSGATPAMAAAAAEPAPAKSAVVVKKTMIAASVPPAVQAAAQAKKAAEQKAAEPQKSKKQASAPVVLPEKPAEVSRPVEHHAQPAMQQHAQQSAPQQQPASTAHLPQQQKQQAARKSALLPILLILLLLALAGAGIYWWVEMRGGDEPAAEPAPEKTPTAQVEAPAKPAEPPPITAALEAGPSEEKQALAPRAGQIAWLAEAGSEVAEGAPVAKFYGFETWEKAIATSQESLKVYQEKLDQATSKDDKVAMKSADTNVKRKQKDLERAQTELQRYVIGAPLAGVVEPMVEAKARVQKDAPVAKVLATSGPRATFTVPPDRKAAAGDEVQVSSKADADLRAKCKVESAEAGKLVVTCPTDSGLAPGTDVVLK